MNASGTRPPTPSNGDAGSTGSATQPTGVTSGGRCWRRGRQALVSASSPRMRHLGVMWVCVMLPVAAVRSLFATTPDAYVWVLVVYGGGVYIVPALFVSVRAVRYGSRGDRLGFALLFAGMAMIVLIGLGVLVGVATGWTWANAAGVPAVVVAGVLHIAALAALVRHRSGMRALSVDVIEASVSVVAMAAPLVVLWGPTVVGAEASWFTVPTAVILVFQMAGTYWVALLCVRLGSGFGVLEGSAVVCSLVGAVNAALQTAQGVSGFTLPGTPLIVLSGLCGSSYLLMPLFAPVAFRPGLDRLPPQAQVRGSWLPTMVPLAGLAVLLPATLAVADERSWVVPFSLGVLGLLVVLGGLRQMAALRETKRLYQEVEEASDERRHLLAQLLKRSVDDRRRVAERLYEQALAAYASMATLVDGRHSGPVVAEASQLVRGDLGRHADSLRELVRSIRPLEGDPEREPRLRAPITAYLGTIYGDRPPPRLSITVADELVLDWVAETVLLQVVQEALRNVWRHSRAQAVEIVLEPTGGVATVRVQDDGTGFDPSTTPEGVGIATMRASAAVIDGNLSIASTPGEGTTVTARLGRPSRSASSPVRSPAGAGARRSPPPDLRLVPPLPD